jgi:hypothetical protein
MTVPLMTQTLPTIIGAHVVSHATDTLFVKRGKRGSRSRQVRGKARSRTKSATIIVGVSSTRSGAENFAIGYRKALKRQGKPYINQVKVKKVQGGYAAIHLRGGR